MKRLTSLLLTLVLALSLTVPALAAEEDPALWQEYGCDSEEACIRDWFDGDAAAYQEEADILRERQTWEKTVMADRIAAFDADDYWNSGQCWQAYCYDSKEEFMKDWVLETEKDFYDCMLDSWLEEEWAVYWESREVAYTKALLGGVDGQIGVMVDGAYVQFPDALPELKNGRTMVPCRQVLEAFGGQVRYEDGQAVCELEGRTLRFRAGSDTAYLTEADGTTAAIPMDVDCYYHNGRTYIPIRFFAEALGCDVLWDSTYDTAVVLRRDKLISELDGQFTVVNRLLSAAARESETNTRTAVTLNGKLTLLDSINGDQTYALDADVKLLRSGSVIDVTARMDLSGLAEVLGGLGELSAPETAQLKKLLKNGELELICDGEEGMLYLKMTGISQLSYGMYEEGSWLAMSAAPLVELETGTAASVGALLYAGELSTAEYGCPALLCRDLRDGAAELAETIGDGCFRDQGNWSVLSYDKEDYMAGLTQEYGPSYALWNSEFEKLDLELKIARSGNATFRVLMQNKASGLSPVYLVDASGTITPVRENMKLLFRLKNTLDLELRYTAVTSETREEPRREPPAGAVIVETGAEPEDLDPFADLEFPLAD